MKHFAKTFSLFWDYLRKDWVKLVSWTALVLLFTLGMALQYPSKYPTSAGRASIIATLKTVSMKSLFGPLQNATTTIANVYSSSLFLWTMIITAIFAIIVANDNSRKQEDTGLLDLTLSRSVGRYAPIVASFLEIAFVNFVLIVMTGWGLSVINLHGSDLSGDWLFAFGIGFMGIFFGALTLLIAQFANDSEENLSFNFILLVLFYLIFIVSMNNSAKLLNWINPFSIVKFTSIYNRNYFTPVWIILILSLVCFVFALILVGVRDIGSGIFPAIPGKKTSPFLTDYPELIVKTQLSSTIIWALILLAFGCMYGSMFASVPRLSATNPEIQQVLDAGYRSSLRSFLFMLTISFAIISTIPGILTIFKLHTDEKRGLLEIIYARPVSRVKVFLTDTVIGSLISMSVFGIYLLGMFLVQNGSLKTPFTFHQFVILFGVNVLPMLLVLSIATFLVVFVTKFDGLIWLVIAFDLFIAFFGKMLKIKEAVANLTCFGMIKSSFVNPIRWQELVLMGIIILVLYLLSLCRYRQKDI